MRLWTTGWLITVFALGSVGCVAQQELDRLEKVTRQKDDQIFQLQATIATLEENIATLKGQGVESAELLAHIEALESERDALQDAMDNAEQQIRSLASRSFELPQQLSDELAALAARHPELMSYDADLGMIKLTSDLTFGLGSAEVRDSAIASLRSLAQVLQSNEARGYEVRVLGHTDTVPIENPATLRNHPTNWHLSAHRAIAVRDVLEDANLPPYRLSVTGYGPFRPVAPNGPDGAEANRRVEIYLVPMTDRDRQMIDLIDGVQAPPAPDPAQVIEAPTTNELDQPEPTGPVNK